MSKNKYWQSFGEKNDSEAFKKRAENEFQEDLPFTASDDANMIDASASRRDFLKYLGFSTAAAIAAASCEVPVRKTIPYLNKPEDMVPGVADYYASTYVSGGEAVPIVAKVREGRPIKIEGNTLSNFTKGGTSARVQASVLDLYDTARLRTPMALTGAKATNTSLEAIDKLVADALGGLGGGQVVILTPTITSPTTKQVIAEFLAKYPGRHVQFDAISYSGMLLANEASYGKKAIPSYHFENAKVIVSFGADFLGTWLSPIEFAKQYSTGRRVNAQNPEMSKHYQFEAMMSMTGANADERYTHRPSEAGLVMTALLSAVQGQGAAGLTGKLKTAVEKAAADLVANKGKALVVSRSNNVNSQLIVNAINEAIGANGTTIDWSTPLLTHQGLDSDMETLVADLEGGRVGALLVYGVNPSYEYYNAARFNKAVKGTKLSILFGQIEDESVHADIYKYIIPAHHFLESWGDAEPKTGYFSMMQPTIYPLFTTRQFQDNLLKWAGNANNYETYFRNYWTGKLGGEAAFNKALQDGVVEPATATIAGSAYNSAKLAEAQASAPTAKKNTDAEILIYQNIALGDGKQVNNPWLLELPDPITRATWENYAMISLQMAEKLNIKVNEDYEVNPEKPILSIKVGQKTIELPTLVIPGMQANTIAVALGYGRNVEKLRAANGFGVNVYDLLTYNGSTIVWTSEAAVSKTTKEGKIAQVQLHNSYEGRHEVVKEILLDEYKKNPAIVLEEREKEFKPYGGVENFRAQGTIYPMYENPGVKWGMNIDLNTCTGCSACVVACHAENNVPVVGKREVARYHDMHWLRIDRYFTFDPKDVENVQTIFQPMLCQHCDNAPCENVCPVQATQHNSEGINQMAYNRCIGTRYCANNCPYKVRRFNWADYTGADSFPNNQKIDWVGTLDEAVFQMNDDLTRMVLNPDVTVRSRGVIEKCSFCVQRLQDGKLKAKKENRPLQDADVQTACQQACPSNAITFGNVNNPDSEISRVRKEQNGRLYYSLEPVHTLPNVNYLTKIRNTNVLNAHLGEEGEAEGKVHA